jgi:hypothetical protein
VTDDTVRVFLTLGIMFGVSLGMAVVVAFATRNDTP